MGQKNMNGQWRKMSKDELIITMGGLWGQILLLVAAHEMKDFFLSFFFFLFFFFKYSEYKGGNWLYDWMCFAIGSA